jgi:hypothetical protein
MKAECGICEYNGDLTSAPWFLCFNCAEAIRRLVWIRDRDLQAAEASLLITHRTAATSEKVAAPNRSR